MIRPTRIATALSLSLFATACSSIPFFGNKDEAPAYSQARSSINNRNLEMPPELSVGENSGSYRIPGLDGSKLSDEGRKALESGQVLPSFTQVKLEHIGSSRWLVVNSPVEKVWPIARQFWLDQGFKLELDSPALGLLQTNWAEQKPDLPVGGIRAAISRGLGTLYNTGMVDQYRMRLERSLDAKGTEIYISYRGMEEVLVGTDRSSSKWTARPTNPEHEAAQLKKLLLRLGVSSDAAQQVLASTVESKPTANSTAPVGVQLLKNSEGIEHIELSDSFERAWRRSGLALERAGFYITDRDRAAGLYYVRPDNIKNKQDDSSFLDKLAFWRDAPKPVENDAQAAKYTLLVSSKDGKTILRFASRDGVALPLAEANGLLEPLFSELR